MNFGILTWLAVIILIGTSAFCLYLLYRYRTVKNGKSSLFKTMPTRVYVLAGLMELMGLALVDFVYHGLVASWLGVFVVPAFYLAVAVFIFCLYVLHRTLLSPQCLGAVFVDATGQPQALGNSKVMVLVILGIVAWLCWQAYTMTVTLWPYR